MPAKDRITRRIDLPAPVMHGASSSVSSTAEDFAPPAGGAPNAPTGLTLTTQIVYSTASPLAQISATWTPPDGSSPEAYHLQVSESSLFPDATTIGFSFRFASGVAGGLKPGVLYYVRVAAVERGAQSDWSATASITTASDTSAAGVPTSISATWIGYGDLLITWTNPTEANLKDIQIVIRASSGGTIYRTEYRAGGSYLYTLAMNFTDTAGVGDPSLYVELRSRTFSNILGTVVNTGLATKAVPATPTGLTQSWSGDTGAAGPDLTISWTSANDAATYTLTLDGVARRVGASRYSYTLDANRAEHAGTPDPAVAYSLVAVDGFGQVSTAASGTATNAAPTTPTATLTQGAVSGLYASVTSTPVADFWRYEYVFKRDGSAVATVYSFASSYRYEMQGASDSGYHSWTVVIRQEDLFGQFSATVTPAAVAFEALTLSGLRAQAEYSDSEGTAPATLKAALADGVTTSGGQVYNP